MTSKKILITGGAGFIGYHLAHLLANERENHIILLDNFSRGRLDEELQCLLEKPNLQMREADLTDARCFDDLPSGFDEVYHLAGILGVRRVLNAPDQVIRGNALATLTLLDWFVGGGGRKLVFASTSEVYAWTSHFYPIPVPTPENVPLALTDLHNPRSSYAESKIFGELAVTQYCIRHGKAFCILRYHNVYGPRMGREHVIPEIYARAIGGENPLLVYSPNHRRSFCYVSDAVAATVLAMRTSAADGRTFNVGNDAEETTIRALAARVLAHAGVNVSLEDGEAANDPIARRCPDISRARSVLGFAPAVSLDEGLARTLAWYKEKEVPLFTGVRLQ